MTETALDAARQARTSMHASERAQTVAQLIPGIVHDFNNSLQSIVAALELARKLVATGRGNEAERFIANAIGTSQRAAVLNERLLSFADGTLPGARPTSMNEVIHGLEEMVRRTLPTSVGLAIDASPDVWDVDCDLEQARVAVVNMILEARDAIPGGGTIRIKTSNVDTRTAASVLANIPPGEYVCFQTTLDARAPADVTHGDAPGSSTATAGSANARFRTVERFAREHAGSAAIHPGSAGGSLVIYLPRIVPT